MKHIEIVEELTQISFTLYLESTPLETRAGYHIQWFI